MKRIKIFMFVYLFPPEYTGASIQAIRLAKKLRNQGAEITFVTGTRTKDSKIKKRYEGFKVIRIWHPINKGNLSILIYWFSILYVLIANRRKYEIIHCHGIMIENILLSIIGKMLGKKSIIKTTLSNEVENLKDYKIAGREQKLKYFALKNFNHIIALSNIIKHKMLESGIENEKILFIPNGVDLKRFKPSENEKFAIRKKFKLPTVGLIFAYIGVIHKRKNVKWMVSEWLNYFQDYEDVYLIIAGPEPRKKLMAEGGGGNQYLEKIKDLVKEKKATDKVIFMPFRKKVEDYFKVSDYFINPSESEGLSNSLLEAMACGVIPVVSRTSGSEDVIKNRSNGYLFDICNTESFKNAMSDIINNETKQRKISKNAKNTIINNFDISMVASKYMQIFNSLIK